jgi:nuclear RNA export factor
VQPADLQKVLDWDKAKFAGVNIKITADVLTDMFNTTMEDVTPQNSNTKNTIAILEEVLRTRYNPQTKMLDLSNLGEDPLLKQNGFFMLGSTTSKMFPALMAVADKKFDSEQAKRDAIVTVSLANNALTSVSPVTMLSLTFPDIKHLSLAGNKLESMKSLEGWKNRFRLVETLSLAGNPIVNLPDYRQEMIRRYPKLTMLDDVPVDRPKIEEVAGPVQNPSTAVDDKGKAILPLPTKGNLIDDPTPNTLIMAFLQKYVCYQLPLYALLTRLDYLRVSTAIGGGLSISFILPNPSSRLRSTLLLLVSRPSRKNASTGTPIFPFLAT